MTSHHHSRRDILHRCFAAGLLIAGAPLTGSGAVALWEQLEAQKRNPTPPNPMGPFYKKRAPHSTKLHVPGDPGFLLVVSGRVVDTRGAVLPEALIEIWHADHAGRYDLEGYRYRAQLPTSPKGDYQFETIMPGHYPGRVAQHIHYLISAPGHKTLVTQLYFATDPAFEGDPDKKFRNDRLVESRELVRPVTLVSDAQSARAAVAFEICLERL